MIILGRIYTILTIWDKKILWMKKTEIWNSFTLSEARYQDRNRNILISEPPSLLIWYSINMMLGYYYNLMFSWPKVPQCNITQHTSYCDRYTLHIMAILTIADASLPLVWSAIRVAKKNINTFYKIIFYI